MPVSDSFGRTVHNPIYHRGRRISPKQNDFVCKEIDLLLEAGNITPSVSAWALPVVKVKKKNGNPKFSFDYIEINIVMKADRWPWPRMEEVFYELGGCCVCMTLFFFTG